MRLVTLITPGWVADPVHLADRFLDRLLGLVAAPAERALLVPGGSVHGLGMRRPLLVAGLAGDGRVLGVVTLRPGKVVWFRGAAAVLELPDDHPPPPVGAVIEVTERPGGRWTGLHRLYGSSRARPAHPLRHPDRQSR